MKILIIGQDNFSIPKMDGHLIDFHIPVNEIKETIAYVLKSNAEVIIIQAEQTATETELYGGLELLIWLRIKGIKTHIVLVSLFSLEELIKNCKNAFILGSKGTSFFQIPFLPSSAELIELSKETSKDDNLKTYLSSIFDIIHFRHAYANVWGLKRLTEVHKLYFPDFALEDDKVDKVSVSLNYNIAEFLYSDKGKNTLSKDLDNDIKSSLGVIKSSHNLKILFIDDKAETGWLKYLKSFFTNESVEIVTIPILDNVQKMYHAFEQENDKSAIDFIISDLRLLTREDEITDYNMLVSIQLMKAILDKALPSGKFKYPKMRYMLLTASNQLLNFLNVLEDNNYLPHRICIKEGFDINNIESQIYNNYNSFVSGLQSTILHKFNNKGAKVANYSNYDAKLIEIFNSAIESKSWLSDIEIINNYFKDEGFTQIVLDSNLYYSEKPLIALTKNSNLIFSLPVFKELQRVANTREFSYREYLAEYFLNIYSSKINYCGMNDDDILEIERLFIEGKSDADFADNYFVRIIQYFSNIPESKVLFISKDVTKKRGVLPPVKQVKDFIKNSGKKNITVIDSPDNIVNRIKQLKVSLTKYESVTSVQSAVNNKKSNQCLKVKWCDCTLLQNGYDLKVKTDSGETHIRVGLNYRSGFKGYFEKLHKTSEEMKLKYNKETMKYNIENISVWINKAKKL